jgi:hypothetical protein
MLRRMKYMTFVFVIFFSQTVSAAHKQEFRRVRPADTITGTIQNTSRNTLEILDEDQKEVRRVVYLGNKEKFRVGERVRVYLEPDNVTVKMIKKMTVLEYRRDGQNLGYTYQK